MSGYERWGWPRNDPAGHRGSRPGLSRADVGPALLVVLDDAADEAQVRPLLPGSGGCAVLVTSRRPLAGLEGAHFVALEPLADAEAVELLGRVAGVERVAAEPVAARVIADRCGRLPLAVRIAGARLAQRDHWSLGVLAARLEDASRRMDELSVGDLEVRANVGLSYRALGERDRQALRLLGVIVGPAFASWLAAAVVDQPLVDAEDTLERLVDRQLLDVVGRDAVGQVRYHFHDLLGDYARERLDADEDRASRRAALDRAYGACLALTERCVPAISSAIPQPSRGPARRWQPPGSDAPLASGAPSPLALLEAERSVLLAAVERAAGAAGTPAWELAASLGCVFELSMRWGDWGRVLNAALARRDHDRRGVAVSLRALGHFHNERGEHAEAARCFEAALAELDTLDDPHELAAALVGLGDAHWSQGHPVAAIPFFERALKALHGPDETGREAWVLYMLGLAHTSPRGGWATRRRCIASRSSAVAGSVTGEGRRTPPMGSQRPCSRGAAPMKPQATMSVPRRSLVKSAITASRRCDMGSASRAVIREGRLEEAVRELRAALTVSRELDYRRGELYALHGLGTTAHRLGQLDEAAAELQRGHAAARAIGDERTAARILHALGDVRLDEGRIEDALSNLRAAVERSRGLQLRLVEAYARASLATWPRRGARAVSMLSSAAITSARARSNFASWAAPAASSARDAEDLVQETYARVLRRPRVLRREDDIVYLLRALRNTWISAHRAASARPVTSDLADVEWVADPGLDPTVAAVELKAIYAAMRDLPPALRETVVAVDVVGLSYRQAARALGTKDGTIMSRLYRARERIASELDPPS